MIEVSSAAERELISILARQGGEDATVRVFAVRGPHGCIHGWRLAIEREAKDEDVVVANGAVGIVVDSGAADDLEGATIDYREDAEGVGFVISSAADGAHRHGAGHACHHS